MRTTAATPDEDCGDRRVNTGTMGECPSCRVIWLLALYPTCPGCRLPLVPWPTPTEVRP